MRVISDDVLVTIGEPVYGGGFGMAGAAGSGATVEFCLPGERVELAAAGVAGGVRIVERSVDRVKPGCVHFGTCGGCQYQQGGYDAQVKWKTAILRDVLEAAGLTELPSIETHTAAEWGYRNRMRVRVADGGARVGYSVRGTNEFLPITMCPITAPLLWQAVEAAVKLAAEDAMCGRWMRSVSEMELFCNGDGSALEVQFFLRDAESARSEKNLFSTFCERLLSLVSQLKSVGAELDPELGRRKRQTWDGASWGAAGMTYRAAGRDYWVARGAFFQVNRLLVDELSALLLRLAGADAEGMAWDLFAGVGLFTKGLAERFRQVVAVEGAAAAASALAASSKGAWEAVHSPTLEFLKARQYQRERPGVVVLDPPRAGLGTEGAAVLAGIGAATVVYVSCDPVTLARDLKVLIGAGYGMEELHLVDLFPQTFHLETVVRLVKR